MPGLDTTSSSGLLWIGRNGVEGLPRFGGILPGQAAETRQARQAGESSDALRGGKVVTAARRFKGG